MSSPLDSKFVQAFLDGVAETFKVQCHLEVKPLKPYIKKAQPALPADIAGIIGITSDKLHGSISICFPEKSFLAAMSGMLGENYSSLTPDLEDGAGELINIIYGFGKRVLNDRGEQLQKALPSVIKGTGLEVRHSRQVSTLVIPYDSKAGPFHVEISIEHIAKAS